MKTYRITVIEWLSHKAVIKAANAEEAEAKARELWDAKAYSQVFSFEDSGLDGVTP